MTLLEWCGVSLYERLFVEDYEGMSREARDPLWDAAVDLRKTAGLPSAFLGAEVVHQLACSYVARAGDMAQVAQDLAPALARKRQAAKREYGGAACATPFPSGEVLYRMLVDCVNTLLDHLGIGGNALSYHIPAQYPLVVLYYYWAGTSGSCFETAAALGHAACVAHELHASGVAAAVGASFMVKDLAAMASGVLSTYEAACQAEVDWANAFGVLQRHSPADAEDSAAAAAVQTVCDVSTAAQAGADSYAATAQQFRSEPGGLQFPLLYVALPKTAASMCSGGQYSRWDILGHVVTCTKQPSPLLFMEQVGSSESREFLETMYLVHMAGMLRTRVADARRWDAERAEASLLALLHAEAAAPNPAGDTPTQYVTKRAKMLAKEARQQDRRMERKQQEQQQRRDELAAQDARARGLMLEQAQAAEEARKQALEQRASELALAPRTPSPPPLSAEVARAAVTELQGVLLSMAARDPKAEELCAVVVAAEDDRWW